MRETARIFCDKTHNSQQMVDFYFLFDPKSQQSDLLLIVYVRSTDNTYHKLQ